MPFCVLVRRVVVFLPGKWYTEKNRSKEVAAVREAILLFGGEAVLPQMRRALLPLKVYIRPIPEGEYTCTLEALAGGEKGAEYSGF